MTGRSLALWDAVLYGVALTFYAYSSRVNGFKASVFMLTISYAVTSLIMLANTPDMLKEITKLGWITGLAAAGIFSVCALLISRCFEVDQAGAVVNSTIMNVGPVISSACLLYIGSKYLPEFLRAQQISWQNVAGLVIACIGVAMVFRKW